MLSCISRLFVNSHHQSQEGGLQQCQTTARYRSGLCSYPGRGTRTTAHATSREGRYSDSDTIKLYFQNRQRGERCLQRSSLQKWEVSPFQEW